MKIIFKYIFLTAIRDWLYLGLLLGLIVAFGFTSIVGIATINEEIAMRLALFGASARAITVIGILLFICFHINRSFENKEIQFILSKNISRYKFILSYWLSFNLISLILMIPVSLLLIILKPDFFGFLQWITSIIFELSIISTLAIISSLIFKSAVVSVLGTSGFYLVARLMGFLSTELLLTNGDKFSRITDQISIFLFKTISLIFPRLDLFGQTKWLVYGGDLYTFKIIIIQAIIYLPIMLLIACYDFRKKQF